MFILRRLPRNNESGIILVTVVMLTVVLSFVVIGIMSFNVSQVSTSQGVVDTIKAEQLAVGGFYQYYQSELDGVTPTYANQTLDGTTFVFSVTDQGNTSTPNGTNAIVIDIAY